jgi:membrane fusion protein, copper/silver efflux system
MKTTHKNTLKYLLVALGGMLIGWLIFGGGGSRQEAAQEHQHAAATEYTCSMHPQIRQDGPGKCPLCGMDLTPVSKSGSGETNPFVLEMTESAVALANIQTTRVRKTDAENAMRLSGKIQINEEKRASVTARFPGRIERLYVNFTGQEIKRGERIASIYSPELISAQRELMEAASTRERNPQLYQAAREKLRLWRLTDRQIQAIENAQEVSTTFDIYSDVAGVVTQRLASPGDYVTTGTVLAEVADLSTVWVVLDAYESNLASIRQGSKIRFTTQSVPGREFEASVAYITPMLDQATRSVEIRAVVPNPQGLLKPEMFVNATLSGSSGSQQQALAIPKSAVLWTGRRSIVYVKDSERETPTFEMREIV